MGKHKSSRRGARRDDNAQPNRGGLGPEREGLVVAHHGGQVAVESAPGVAVRCHLRAGLEGLVTGDRVIWREGEPTGVVEAQLPRTSALSRPDGRGRLKPIAANIDQLVVVVAPVPRPWANLIDRYLVAAETLSIEPLILLNKCDLLEENPPLRAEMADLLAPYPAIGYRVLHTGDRPGESASLAMALRGRVSVFIGQSGVGKSSLVNRLVPDADVPVGELSQARGKGRHTTTTARLLHLAGGGRLIDSPGIRDFGLWHMSRGELALGFREFRPFLDRCRFRDCSHTGEPGCAVVEAAAGGAISERRLDSFRHIAAGHN